MQASQGVSNSSISQVLECLSGTIGSTYSCVTSCLHDTYTQAYQAGQAARYQAGRVCQAVVDGDCCDCCRVFYKKAQEYIQLAVTKFSDTIAAIYQAALQFFSTLCGYVVSPICWMSRQIERHIVHTILPTSTKSADEVRELQSKFEETRGDLKNAGFINTKSTLKIDDTTTLNGIKITYAHSKRQTFKLVVYFLPEDLLWEEAIPQLKDIALLSGATVHCYNYRGTGLSTGTLHTEKDLIDDGEKIIESLLKEQIDRQAISSDDISLHGSSFGGGVAIKLAEKYARKDSPINFTVCNERSSSSLQDAITYRIPVIGRLFGFIMSLYGWCLNAEEALPYLGKNLISMDEPEDTVIYPGAQFKDAVDRFRLLPPSNQEPHIKNFREIQMVNENNAPNAHIRPWSEIDKSAYKEAMDNELDSVIDALEVYNQM